MKNEDFSALTIEAQEHDFDRYQLALRASNEGIWDWDLENDAWFCSQLVRDFFEQHGLPSENLIKYPEMFVAPEDLGSFREVLRVAMEDPQQETMVLDSRVVSRDNTRCWLRIRGAIVRGSDQQVLRIAGTMIDISRRKGAEQSLIEEQHLLRLVIDNLPLHVYFKDQKSKFTLVNKPMADWMGLDSTEEMVGTHDKDFFSQEHWEKAEHDEQEIMRTGKPLVKEVEKETWRGAEDTWVMTTKMPWLNSQGDITGVFGVSSDVSDLVKTQQELERVAMQLHKRNEAYEEELSLAHEIQQALVHTKTPLIRSADFSLKFSQRYLPISGLAGDFFDVQKLGDNKVGVFICDVMGHGVRSALIVTMLRGLMEKARDVATEPHLYLGSLNEGLSGILNRAKVTMFATACYLVFDLEQRTLTYCTAGHPAPIVRKNGQVSTLDVSQAKGAALGLIPGMEYVSATEALDGFEKILLFTDGIFEAENSEGEAFMLRRLRDAVEASGDVVVDEMLDNVLKSVLAFAEAKHFDDDVCLLGIDVRCGG